MLLQISEKHQMGLIKHSPHWPTVLMRCRGEVPLHPQQLLSWALGKRRGYELLLCGGSHPMELPLGH